MIICHCNPFNHKALEKALKDNNIQKTPQDVYKACSGGKKPNCATCMCEVKKQVKQHNNKKLLMAAE